MSASFAHGAGHTIVPRHKASVKVLPHTQVTSGALELAALPVALFGTGLVI